MSFQPQRIFPWPGKRAVLLVHGIGDASTGKDGAFPLDVLKKSLGDDAANVAIYRINYDFINDWLSTKVNFQAGIAALKAKVKKNLGSDDLDDMQSTDQLIAPADEVDQDLVSTDRRVDASQATPAIWN